MSLFSKKKQVKLRKLRLTDGDCVISNHKEIDDTVLNHFKSRTDQCVLCNAASTDFLAKRGLTRTFIFGCSEAVELPTALAAEATGLLAGSARPSSRRRPGEFEPCSERQQDVVAYAQHRHGDDLLAEPGLLVRR
jgi:hypothetical protein